MKLLTRNSDTLTGLLFFCLSLVLLFETRRFATAMETIRAIGPQVFPNAIAGTMAVLSLILFIRGLGKPYAPLGNSGALSRKAALIAGLTCCIASSIVLLNLLGLVLWMICFLMAGQYILGERSWRRMVCLALGIAAVMYAIFVIGLSISFPVGMLGF